MVTSKRLRIYYFTESTLQEIGLLFWHTNTIKEKTPFNRVHPNGSSSLVREGLHRHFGHHPPAMSSRLLFLSIFFFPSCVSLSLSAAYLSFPLSPTSSSPHNLFVVSRFGSCVAPFVSSSWARLTDCGWRQFSSSCGFEEESGDLTRVRRSFRFAYARRRHTETEKETLAFSRAALLLLASSYCVGEREREGHARKCKGRISTPFQRVFIKLTHLLQILLKFSLCMCT